ncbi:hypothetical protein BD414DRAFT_505191 [Trametes punicea]|nr:hypothetical protein BD414DRAFT_505191 [Trametes punicea]
MASSSTAQRIDISRDPQAPSILLRLVGPNVAAYSAAERYIGSLRGFFPNEHIHDTGAESDAPSSPTTSVTLATPPPLSPTHLKSHLPITLPVPHLHMLTIFPQYSQDKPDSESLDASDIRYFGSEDYRRARREIRPASGKLVPAHLDPPFLAVKDGKYHILGYYARVVFDQYGSFNSYEDHYHSWVRSANYCELKADGTCAPRPDEWSAFKEHPLIFEGGLDCLDKRIQGHASTVQYDDGARALVYQFPPGADLKLMAVVECHDWNADRWHSGVRFRYIPGLAIAVNEELERDRVDGIMGLGLLPHQEDDPSSPPWKDNSRDQHFRFAAFNKWPCSNMPVFSAEIPVKPRAVNQAFRSWDVELIKLQIKDYNRKTGTYSKPVDIPLAVSTSSAAQTSTRSRQDFRVALDTGKRIIPLSLDLSD